MINKSHIPKKPNVICIGPPKTATSWLYAVLKNHKEVDLPPVKELSYFKGDNFAYDTNFYSFLTKKDWYNTKKRKIFKKISKELFRKINRPSFESIRWHYYYLFFGQSDKWYRNLFVRSNKKVSMDISPVYSYLDNQAIESIYSRFPYLKVVISLRNPIYRTWSHIKMDICKRQNINPEDLK